MVFKKFSEIVSSAKEKTEFLSTKLIDEASKVAEEYKVSEKLNSAKGQIEEGYTNTKNKIEEKTPDSIKDASKKVLNSVDVITGTKLLDTVMEALENQDKYNDILATKLEEALNRISILESAINSSKK